MAWGPVGAPPWGSPRWGSAPAGAGGSRHALLSRLRVLHQRLFQQVEAVTAHFGTQLLFKLVQTRIQLITDSYALVKVLSSAESDRDDSDEKLAFYALEVCFLAYRLFCVVYRSEKVVQQVGATQRTTQGITRPATNRAR